MTVAIPAVTRPKTHLAVLVVLGVTHLLNDLMQSLIPAAYPILKDAYALDFVQIGMITMTFQIAGSLLQPAIGMVTDKHPAPYSPVVGMMFTLSGLVSLALADSYAMILVSVALIGIGSSIFHPEATRMARYAAGGRQGLAQGLFQVGGQAGGALGPVFAAVIIVPWGQPSLAWFAALALLAMVLLAWIGGKQREISAAFMALRADSKKAGSIRHAPATIGAALVVLTLLMFTKNAYGESFRSFYTFYLMEKFGLSIPSAQMMLFIFLLASAAGALIGGIVGDRIGRYRIIWISVLGPLPLTLILPHADLFWTGVLTVMINLIMASAFASILIYAIELLPNRIGLIGGLFYGLNFGLGGIAAALLGILADSYGVETVYYICSFLPLAGLLAWFLPKIEEGHS
ncbi:MFS transporter [Ensifer sp. ENS07]|jgi:FSR family fosmidomycin resistance protein-like MFS transporter|uniref:MFS transporter n=1 Tax=Ensifer adhaerens TaxID=106592 RepID=A0ABY8HQ26_ENSAD|nr:MULTISPECIES: MFS transporter [Ensifer]KDP75639.1 Fosmidomycin resistance protein [Ensifer adhaerens]MBD9559773.1 MFS transporter [Ensifer sp. ENS03]MBD9640335.1 MFS transporter [Ensifer sp. ENS07]MBW0365278.1 MFS transporter [Ensifer adhaerens]UCM22623.1 MFS transporter [Ensifer adhaerens]